MPVLLVPDAPLVVDIRVSPAVNAPIATSIRFSVIYPY